MKLINYLIYIDFKLMVVKCQNYFNELAMTVVIANSFLGTGYTS